MATSQEDGQKRRVPAIRFKQWLEIWNGFDFNARAHRKRPPEHLYMFSMPAADLRRLCDVYRRKREGAEAEGIQRYRDPTRTGRIQRYVRHGYPYGDLKPPQRNEEARSLQKPGWLPTAIVVNILRNADVRHGRQVKPEHLISVVASGNNRYDLNIPSVDSLDESSLAPLEVIDGQHRLWAFDREGGDDVIPDDFELPVVAYHGLDVAWQAYLFWSINVSPKKINPSHAFDLYPLLRTQDWLDRVGELTVYREARAQELTEIIYSNRKSPWCDRINMLGERGAGSVSQATWIRGLMTTFLSTGRGAGRFGLFQSNLLVRREPLEWTRPQQAAFIITIWSYLQAAAQKNIKTFWIREYESDARRALQDRTSMLNQDQGIRAVMAVFNDIFFENAEEWQLERWIFPSFTESETSESEVDLALNAIERTQFINNVCLLSERLIDFDWRSLDAPGVKGNADLEVRKRSYRGSGGYVALRQDVLQHLSDSGDLIGRTASSLLLS